jgi:hypothetical protein
MTKLETLDFILKALYLETQKNSYLKISNAGTKIGLQFSNEETHEFKNILEMNGYALFQRESKTHDYLGQITPKGISFAETSSFSKRDKSILTQ